MKILALEVSVAQTTTLTTGPSSNGWVQLVDNTRMNRADERAAELTKNERIHRTQ